MKNNIIKKFRKRVGIGLILIGFCLIWFTLVIRNVSNGVIVASEIKIKESDITLNYKIDDVGISIPIVKDMVPQGMIIVKNRNLISAYDYKQEKNSVIYVVDKKGNIVNTCQLDIISHVGGLAYDYSNNLIWVAGVGGYINAYNIEEVLTKENVQTIYKVNVGDGLIDFQNDKLSLVSFLTYYRNVLYVGSFSLNSRGIVKKYRISIESDEINLNYLDSFKIPDKVQGIAFYNLNDNDYMFLSISFGRENDSKIKGYIYDEAIKDYTKKRIRYVEYNLPPMVEQITIDNNLLYALYESQASVYSNCSAISNNVTIIEIKNIIRELG